jgi:hypothetical protein
MRTIQLQQEFILVAARGRQRADNTGREIPVADDGSLRDAEEEGNKEEFVFR